MPFQRPATRFGMFVVGFGRRVASTEVTGRSFKISYQKSALLENGLSRTRSNGTGIRFPGCLLETEHESAASQRIRDCDTELGLPLSQGPRTRSSPSRLASAAATINDVIRIDAITSVGLNGTTHISDVGCDQRNRCQRIRNDDHVCGGWCWHQFCRDA